jgi:hypothetical protein
LSSIDESLERIPGHRCGEADRPRQQIGARTAIRQLRPPSLCILYFAHAKPASNF